MRIPSVEPSARANAPNRGKIEPQATEESSKGVVVDTNA